MPEFTFMQTAEIEIQDLKRGKLFCFDDYIDDPAVYMIVSTESPQKGKKITAVCIGPDNNKRQSKIGLFFLFDANKKVICLKQAGEWPIDYERSANVHKRRFEKTESGGT